MEGWRGWEGESAEGLLSVSSSSSSSLPQALLHIPSSALSLSHVFKLPLWILAPDSLTVGGGKKNKKERKEMCV